MWLSKGLIITLLLTGCANLTPKSTYTSPSQNSPLHFQYENTWEVTSAKFEKIPTSKDSNYERVNITVKPKGNSKQSLNVSRGNLKPLILNTNLIFTPGPEITSPDGIKHETQIITNKKDPNEKYLSLVIDGYEISYGYSLDNYEQYLQGATTIMSTFETEQNE